MGKCPVDLRGHDSASDKEYARHVSTRLRDLINLFDQPEFSPAVSGKDHTVRNRIHQEKEK